MSDRAVRAARSAGLELSPQRRATLEPFVDWPFYHGSDTGNSHSPLDQIDRDNVGELALQWFFPIPDMPMIEGTPVVLAGVMYVTAVNQVYALDAATGREIWRYAQPRTEGLVGDPAIGLNRGVAVRGNLVFSVTDHAHVVALDVQTGRTVWSYEQAGEASTFSGVLSTAGDVVFFGENSGAFAAPDAWSGESLWHVQINQEWRASPMTYMAGGRQYVAIASRLGFWAFALP